ncbi:NupC/NupG family nucleoside CNT transporter [Litorilituus sediminis]|uniref:Nucleoside permease n=1 Tax=Litorilituus sediminis TaxID=718192 RepID=A0A4P6P2T7_9GAMM|nr:NupC/NupG family nucleoside CNT transporter [Litorilituus sediminis]QBG35008.1 NupC/NupG family nucleoside CNT transporter [Litorilituus sediminis]
MELNALRGVLGIVVLLAIAYWLSSSKKSINYRTVGLAFALQVLLGAFVLYVPFGKDVLTSMTDGVQSVIDSAKVGINFLFGGLGTDAMFENGVGFVFAVRVLPNIIFFSSLIAVLYYLGIMQWVIKIIGGGLQKLLRTSKPESLSATANIFVGQTEAPLVVRPYIAKMTQSELFAIMVGGLASVAGSILAGYAGLGIELKYLIAASFMAAPGGLLMAKIICPETESDKITKGQVEFSEGDDKPTNVIDAAASGAASGLKLAVNVGAMLLAFIALIALLNTLVGSIAGIFGYQDITIELLLGYLFAPFAFIVGVPTHEMLQAGSFIGQKIVVNEFFAYVNFVEIKDSLTPTTQAIVTFALCGFANLSSIAILLGGIGSMAPSRRHDIARLGMRAMLAATLANLMSAAIAGVFISL